MGGLCGIISTEQCACELFYGTDYNSHLGTRRGGLVTYEEGKGFFRSIHSLENSYFRTRFEDELDKFVGKSGIGVISDTDAQPMLVNSHLGRFAIATVAKVNNAEQLADKFLSEGMYLTEFSSGRINITELISLLIVRGKTFKEGIENVYREVKGSCSILILTEDGIIAARDAWGRTPLVVGKKDGVQDGAVGDIYVDGKILEGGRFKVDKIFESSCTAITNASPADVKKADRFVVKTPE